MMKKIMVIFMAMVFVAAFSTVSFAVITGSAHDFSSQAWNSGGEICVTCHTPHNPNPGGDVGAPLWNHDITETASFTLYSSTTMDATDMGQPTGVSKLCLSCHDGTVALDSFGGATGSTSITGEFLVGTDLSNDHPVSFTYDTTLANADGELTNPSAANSWDTGKTIADTVLFSDKLECASCHDVHNADGFDRLLRKDNAASALCLTCHAK